MLGWERRRRANPGSGYVCNATVPTTCEVGDLAGKHGTLVAVDAVTPVTATYTDAAVMLHGPTSVVGLSVVVHAPNGTRLVCATIVALTGTGTVRWAPGQGPPLVCRHAHMHGPAC